MFNILTGGNTPTQELITQKANRALGMFHSVINTLEESIIEANNLASKNQELIDNLSQENNYLDNMTQSNQKVISNIKALISNEI